MIKGIIFDYDGVIADSISVQYKIIQKVARKFGGKPFSSFDDFRERFSDWRPYYQSFDPSNPHIVGEAERMFYAEFHKLRPGIRLYDGIADVIVKLSKNYKLGIASHSSLKTIESALRRSKLLKYFDSIAGGDSTEKLKPHPDHLRICMNELKIKPSETCEVGDAMWDIKAARAAKVAKIIAVTYGLSTASKLQDTDVTVVDSPHELLAVLEAL